MKTKLRRCAAAFMLTVLITNAAYTIVHRFAGSNPATLWLPLYDWIYNTNK